MLQSRNYAALAVAATLTLAGLNRSAIAAEVVAEGDVRNNGQALSGSQGPTLTGGPLGVGLEQPGRLSVLGGGRVDLNSGFGVASFPDSSGVVRVDGFGSTLRSSSAVIAGRGSGLLQITNGGSVDVSQRVDVGFEFGSLGTIDVSGFGSSLRAQEGRFGVMPGGTGRLDVSAGGRAAFTSQVALGGYANGAADATVSGAGSLLSSYSLQVDRSATLTLRDGGTAASEQAMGVAGGGRIVLGDGVVFAPGGFRVGPQGRVEGSGEIRGPLEMGPEATLAVAASGGLFFPGDALHVADGLVQVGAGGTLSFADGIAQVRPMAQVVTRGGELRADHWQHAGSLAVLDGGTTVVVGTFANQNGRVLASGNAGIEFFDAVTNNGLFDVRPGSTATFLDRVNGAGSFAGGGEYVFLGTFAPGNSPATVNFTGDLTFGPDSVLEVEIFGTDLSEFDRLLVDGDVTVNGSDLQVVLGNDFVPSLGDEFEFLTFDSLTGGFDFDGFVAPNGVSLELRSTPTSLRLVAVPEPAGLMLTAGLGGLALLRRRRA